MLAETEQNARLRTRRSRGAGPVRLVAWPREQAELLANGPLSAKNPWFNGQPPRYFDNTFVARVPLSTVKMPIPPCTLL